MLKYVKKYISDNFCKNDKLHLCKNDKLHLVMVETRCCKRW